MNLFKSIFTTILSFIAPQFGIPLKILSAIKQWRPSFSELIIIGLSIFLLFDTIRIGGLHIKPHIGPIHFTLVDVKGLVVENQDLKNQVVQMKNNEELARNAQITANEAPEKDTKVIAENTNAQSDATQSKINQAVNAYAMSHRVSQCMRGNEPTNILGGTPNLPVSDNTAQSSSGSDVGADVVAISRDDFTHYNQNTKDLLELRSALKEIIDDGYATVDIGTPIVN